MKKTSMPLRNGTIAEDLREFAKKKLDSNNDDATKQENQSRE